LDKILAYIFFDMMLLENTDIIPKAFTVFIYRSAYRHAYRRNLIECLSGNGCVPVQCSDKGFCQYLFGGAEGPREPAPSRDLGETIPARTSCMGNWFGLTN